MVTTLVPTSCACISDWVGQAGNARERKSWIQGRGLETYSVRKFGGSLGESNFLISKDPESTMRPAPRLTETFWNGYWTVGGVGVCRKVARTAWH